MPNIIESSIEEMNLWRANKKNKVVNFIGSKSQKTLYNKLLSLFSGKNTKSKDICFNFLYEAILCWMKDNYGNEMHLHIYINQDIANDAIFMSKINASFGNAFLMAFRALNNNPARSTTHALHDLNITFYFVNT